MDIYKQHKNPHVSTQLSSVNHTGSYIFTDTDGQWTYTNSTKTHTCPHSYPVLNHTGSYIFTDIDGQWTYTNSTKTHTCPHSYPVLIILDHIYLQTLMDNGHRQTAQKPTRVHTVIQC